MNNLALPFAEQKVARTAYLFSVALIALMAGTTSALAAKITVTDGTTISQNGGTYTSDTDSYLGSALYASGIGSVINGSNLTINGGTYYNAKPVYAGYGGTINLTGSTQITGTTGLYAIGQGNQTTTGELTNATISTITMNGGSVTTTGGYGVNVGQGGSVNLANVAITSSSKGIYVGYGGNLTMKGGSITTTGTDVGISVSAHQYSGSGNNKYFNYANASLDGVTITSVGTGIQTQQVVLSNTANLTVKNFSVTTSGQFSYGLNANVYSNTYLENGTIKTSGQEAEGIWATSYSSDQRQTKVTGKSITIITEGLSSHGVYSDNAIVDLTDSHITVNRAFGLYADPGGLINFTGNSSIKVKGQGGTAVLAYGSGSQINIDGSTITTEADGTRGFQVWSTLVSVKNSNVSVGGNDSYGVYVTSGATFNAENTKITVSGEGNTFGLVFVGATALNTVSLKGGYLSVPKSTAIIAQGGTDLVSLSNATVSGDALLVAQKYVNGANSYGAKVSINADNTKLQGAADVDTYSYTNITLNNGSTWTITPSTSLDSAVSHVSILNLNDSTVSFSAPSGDVYQTLTVGSGVPGTTAVYNATGNARLSLNTFFNEGGELSNQHTDRLLINGDVAGTTQVIVKGVVGSPGGYTSSAGNNLATEGISLIQVSGAATENSFTLLGGYTTLDRMPYKYSLYAYGPGSSHGEANEGQRLVEGTDPHWDYRLQSVYREIPPEPKPGPEPKPEPGPQPKPVREVVPQIANYLTAPIALFQAGQMDVGNLHRRLGEIRDDRAMGRNSGKGEFFIRAYGGMYDYTSNRNTYAYGYDANIDYAAVQLGGNLYAFESKTSITRFGVAGSIGSLSSDPKNVKNTSATSLNTWSISAYATYLHDSGWYVDGVVSYGQFDGSVSQNIRGKTADLKGHSFSVSLETGYPFKLGYGLVLEPQAQLLYQRLMFDRTVDIADHFDVALGTQDQLLARAGARLSKSLEQTQKDKLVTLYAKANVLHAFGDGGKVFLGDTFRLGRFGTALEAGLGVNAILSKNLSLYADAAYQHRLGGHGLSGFTLTGGMRYDF